VLESAYPDSVARALVLFAWFGSGKGPWNGHPAYESVAEDLLMALPLADLLRALESPGFSDQQLEVAARFFAGWDRSRKRRWDLARLPESIRRRLLEHSMQSTDSDRRSRAKAAFTRI
jgi:hypothetical protein